MVMNTARGQFSDDAMPEWAKGTVGPRGVFTGLNLRMVIGQTPQKTVEQCLREFGMEKIRLPNSRKCHRSQR